jgi:hypothetical protein
MIDCFLYLLKLLWRLANKYLVHISWVKCINGIRVHRAACFNVQHLKTNQEVRRCLNIVKVQILSYFGSYLAAVTDWSTIDFHIGWVVLAFTKDTPECTILMVILADATNFFVFFIDHDLVLYIRSRSIDCFKDSIRIGCIK